MMNELELSRIDDSKFNSVITPVKREKKIHENPLIIGFDAKAHYLGSRRSLLSLHFCTKGQLGICFLYGGNRQLELVEENNIKYSFETLTDYIVHFISELEIQQDIDCIYLVTHDAKDELSHFVIPQNYKFRSINKGLCLEGKIKVGPQDREIRLKVIDLYSLTSKSLSTITKYTGLPGPIEKDYAQSDKVSTADINISEQLDSILFDPYYFRDARITYEAYTRLRADYIEKHQVDILNFYTLSSVAGYLFRRDHLDKPAAKSKVLREPRGQKKSLCDGSNKYYEVLQKKEIFDGDLNVRKCSMLAYHGARIETFCRGRFEDKKLIYYDVDSLYPSSAILQPLPVASTRWIKYSKRNAVMFLKKAEGFVEVEFRYSPDTLYPCLPVSGLRDGILYFPISGTTYCTISELRMAIKLGLKDYKILSGYGFYPTKRNREHPLAIFMNDLLERKQRSDRGSLEYSMYKMQMNSLVGKFAQRDKNSKTLSMLREGSISRDAYGKIDKFRKSTVGSLWYPEWASLILGKARALMSEFISKGTYFVSSDSVLLPADTDINCDSLQQLRSVGSDLRKEFSVDHGIIIRARLYVLNPLNENPKERHLARHAVSCEPEEFSQIMTEGYMTRHIPNLSFTSKKAVKYEKSLLEGKELNSIEMKESKIDIKWDGKRKLFKEVVNPFADFSWSEALDAEEVENNGMRRPPKEKPGRKPGKKLDTAKKRDIVRLYEEGKKQREIVEELEVSKGYVSKVLHRIVMKEETKMKLTN